VRTSLPWYKKAVDYNHAAASSALDKLANSSAEHAYAIAQLCGNDPKAIFYYMSAVKKDHPGATAQMMRLANTSNKEAQYALGYEYYQKRKGSAIEAVKLCMKAAQKKHPEALQFMQKTTFTPDACLEIARIYEKGVTGIFRNITRAIEFYTKAGTAEAHLYLAEMYQVDQIEVPLNLEISWQHYLAAAKLGSTTALRPLERMAEEMRSNRKMELAALFKSLGMNYHAKTLEWYKKAEKVGNAAAKRALIDFPQQPFYNRTQPYKL
jgi:hypothetical protein